MKDIKGYEGLYAVTSCGKVWSYKSQRFLKGTVNHYGYVVVDLYKGKLRKQVAIHRLVAETYIPCEIPNLQVNHKDENKQHNYLNNLEWVTCKANINYGSRNAKVSKKLSKPIYCKELDRVFDSQQSAARELKLDSGKISNVCNGKRKTTGGYHFTFIDAQ